MVLCTNCGKETREGKFCTNCGHPLVNIQNNMDFNRPSTNHHPPNNNIADNPVNMQNDNQTYNNQQNIQHNSIPNQQNNQQYNQHQQYNQSQNQQYNYQQRAPVNKKSKAIGLILNFLIVGMGYAYVGKWGEGIIMLVLFIIMMSLSFLLIPFVIGIALWIYTFIKTNEMIDKYNQGLPY